MTLVQWAEQFGIALFLPTSQCQTFVRFFDPMKEAWLYSLSDYVVKTKTAVGYWLVPR